MKGAKFKSLKDCQTIDEYNAQFIEITNISQLDDINHGDTIYFVDLMAMTPMPCPVIVHNGVKCLDMLSRGLIPIEDFHYPLFTIPKEE